MTTSDVPGVFFPDAGTARRIATQWGTPVFVYDETTLRRNAGAVLAFPSAFGLTARFAMKALPSRAVLRLFHAMGLHVDASSGFEARRAMLAGIPAGHIRITAQELPADLADLVRAGCLFTACSPRQLEVYGQLFPGSEVALRMNPGLGSGHSNRTNVGGPASSFGLWRDYAQKALETAARHGLRITMLHTHIGSGADPEVWVRCADLALDLVKQFPDVATLGLGGGYKVARMPGEHTADLRTIGERVAEKFRLFAERHGRPLHLEIEPGTYLTATAGVLLCSVIDVVDTGPGGYRFIKTDAGMTENLRPSLYGAQHPIRILRDPTAPVEEDDFVVVGHCCESGDILTPAPGDPEALGPRRLPVPEPGDLLAMGACGAYCAGMAAKNYNSFPEAPEVLLRASGEPVLVRRRQTLEQVVENELDVSLE
ncbi:MAG TPA: diaminopimelate decarboxylase [Candidatus Hydrogenedentes bacterium]|nr:diaminopimelate decarboxylase [Candidatus Hydrogenedentota bacterium]HOJ68000.1 diaminopimelate decarboxylase [Candidatus Hydrogenedentota bacterium]HOK88478.1 diaminopimelate decarboxylase [Candidatus Hydrogenedentota bacterium]HOV60746.1 diaminopimelate decarboxylase [Candidatus Hydrogenedentota bacterium]